MATAHPQSFFGNHECQIPMLSDFIANMGTFEGFLVQSPVPRYPFTFGELVEANFAGYARVTVPFDPSRTKTIPLPTNESVEACQSGIPLTFTAGVGVVAQDCYGWGILYTDKAADPPFLLGAVNFLYPVPVIANGDTITIQLARLAVRYYMVCSGVNGTHV